MEVYAELGVEPVINAAGTLTRFGGSLMPPEVVAAMAAASRAFVDMDELHRAAGRRIAGLVGAEAAHICCGAAAGIALMAAACMAGTDPERIRQLPDTTGMKRRFVVPRVQRNAFDQALRLAGGEFVEIEATAADLARQLDPTVAGVFYTCAWFCTEAALPLPEVTALARAAGVPVIVDAAAEVPPAANLGRYLAEGVDLVVFSGGKGIRGPQASGFILGRPDLVEACRLNDNPHMAVGRPMKVGKEEIAGLVRAVELYVARDHAAELAEWERRVDTILTAVADLDPVRAWRQMPHGTGQLVPHAAVTWAAGALPVSPAEVAARLLAGPPRIAAQLVPPARTAGTDTPQLRFHPHTLEAGQAERIAQRMRELMAG